MVSLWLVSLQTWKQRSPQSCALVPARLATDGIGPPLCVQKPTRLRSHAGSGVDTESCEFLATVVRGCFRTIAAVVRAYKPYDCLWSIVEGVYPAVCSRCKAVTPPPSSCSPELLCRSCPLSDLIGPTDTYPQRRLVATASRVDRALGRSISHVLKHFKECLTKCDRSTVRVAGRSYALSFLNIF